MASDSDLHRCTVLVVDDDQELRDVLALALDTLGFRVRTASNGREALHLLRSLPDICAVMLDVLMPVMDGAMFRETQLRDRSLRGIPIVAMTGAPEGVERARAIGAAALLQKPLDFDELRETLGRVCRHRNGHGGPPP